MREVSVREVSGPEVSGPEEAESGAADGAGYVAEEERHLAHNYAPLPVIISEADGCWVTDVEGRRYLDCLAAYSALAFGHRPPELLAVAHAQLDRLTLTSRAFHHDRLAGFARDLAALCGREMVLPANTGVEAVEAAIKVVRKWGYEVKRVPADCARIIVAERNFHGRTISVVSFSTNPVARRHFGPFTPGFDVVPFGDARALEDAVTSSTVAVLIEPIQGEAGVRVPPEGYLRAVRDVCDRHRLLFVADEIQSGLGRTGATFACDHEQVRPDVYVLGKALGGGIVPVSAVVADGSVLGVLRPGEHGSKFGGNPLACAVGHQVVRMLSTGHYLERSRVLGARMHDGLRGLLGSGLLEVRGRGLWAGLDIDPSLGSGGDLRAPAAARGAGEGHSRLDDPAGATVDRRRVRGGLDGGAAGRRAPGQRRRPLVIARFMTVA